LIHSIIEKYGDVIRDSGPFYHEFHADAFIKEPWNAYSSLLFLAPAIYWTWRLRGQYRENMIITVMLPLLYMNGIGSTLYHAFRASDIWLFLDGVPAMLLGVILSGYMWTKVLRSRWKAVVTVILFYAAGIAAVFALQPVFGDAVVNLSYLFTSLCFLVPVIIFVVRTRFYKWHLLFVTFLFLGLALLFRSLDYPTPNPFPELLPQGTHFLWHIMSAPAVITLGYYLFYTKNLQPGKKFRMAT
jgi:hemolysin III